MAEQDNTEVVEVPLERGVDSPAMQRVPLNEGVGSPDMIAVPVEKPSTASAAPVLSSTKDAGQSTKADK